MRQALVRGGLYWLAVFAVAFVLGIIRTVWIAPRLGTVAAVLVELPVVLAVSWLVARRLFARGLRLGQRLAAGGFAFALLMLAEATLASLLFGTPPAIWAASLLSAAGLLGLAGQLGFALMPALVGRR